MKLGNNIWSILSPLFVPGFVTYLSSYLSSIIQIASFSNKFLFYLVNDKCFDNTYFVTKVKIEVLNDEYTFKSMTLFAKKYSTIVGIKNIGPLILLFDMVIKSRVGKNKIVFKEFLRHHLAKNLTQSLLIMY